MAHPQVSIEYLLELEELQKQMPTLRLWQLDGVLRARAGTGPTLIPPPPAMAALMPVAVHAPAEERPLQALSVEAEPYAPIAQAAEPKNAVHHIPTFAEIASLRPKQGPTTSQPTTQIQTWLNAAAKAMVAQQQEQQQHAEHTRAVAGTDAERRSPSRLEVTGPRRGRESPA